MNWRSLVSYQQELREVSDASSRISFAFSLSTFSLVFFCCLWMCSWEREITGFFWVMIWSVRPVREEFSEEYADSLPDMQQSTAQSRERAQLQITTNKVSSAEIKEDLLARTTKMTATTIEINQIDTWACFSSCFWTIASSFSSFSHLIGTLWREKGSRK